MLAVCAKSGRAACRKNAKFIPAVQQKMQFHATASRKNWDLADYKIGGRSSVSGITATVFGCSGLVGKTVVDNLGQFGSKVVVPFRGDGMNVRHLKMMGDLGQIIPVPFDIKDSASVEKAVSKSNVVINLIGNKLETHNFSYRNTYVDTTKTIVDACKKHDVKRIVNISHVNAAMDSESAWLQANAEADALLHDEFPDATTLKVTQTFGELDQLISKYAALANWAPITPIVNPTQKIQPIAASDVGNAVLNAVLKPEAVGQTYYLGGPEILELKDLLLELQKEMWIINPNVVTVPEKAGRLIGYYNSLFRMVAKQAALLSEDHFIQEMNDNVVPEWAALTLKDLDIENPIKLSGEVLSTLTHLHRQERGPDVKPKGTRTWEEIIS